MREYSEKELAIFCGVFRLTREGVPVKEITAKQIATAAGMGKATIYDYFSSKEDIIFQALTYAAAKQNRLVNEKLSEISGFRDKMLCIYSEIINTVENSFSVFNLISYLGSRHDSTGCFQCSEYIRHVEEVIQNTRRTLMDIIHRGVEQGVISCHSQRYLDMILEANIIATGKTRAYKSMPAADICENAYMMLIKALA